MMSAIKEFSPAPFELDLGVFDKPVLVFGGPYSNIQALDALLAEATRLRIDADHMICTGDVVAYCGDPEATTQRMIDAGIATVKGNCEVSFGEAQDDCGCGFEPGSACDILSKDWVAFANRQLSAGSRAWMRATPDSIVFQMNGKSVRIFHGALSHISKFIFASDPVSTKWRELNVCSEDILIGGHAGLPFVEPIADRLWLNAGVVGMPANDGTARVWYSVLRPAGNDIEVEVRALDYDHRGAAEAMARNGLPSGYRQALATGLWPSLDILPDAERDMTGRPLAEVIYRYAQPEIRAAGS